MMELKRTSSDNEDFRALVCELDKELWNIYDERQGIYDQHNIIENNRNVIVAYINNIAVGCGCFKKFDEQAVEIKRMYVKPEYRGQKIAASILDALEQWARELNIPATVLETGIKQLAAMHLYGKSGYIVVANYGPYKDMPESVCMHKQLV
jgi:GNAT superfamily N-acetyltransferase